MKIEQVFEGIRYTLSNDNLKIHDEVFPIGRGRCLDDETWILSKLDYRDFMSGFPLKPHTIKDLDYSEYKPYEIQTSHGFGPVETYYKIIKQEKLK